MRARFFLFFLTKTKVVKVYLLLYLFLSLSMPILRHVNSVLVSKRHALDVNIALFKKHFLILGLCLPFKVCEYHTKCEKKRSTEKEIVGERERANIGVAQLHSQIESTPLEKSAAFNR